MDGDVVSGMCVGLVALLSFVELKWTLPAAAQLTRPRVSLECRCPYCHQAIDDGTARVRCRFCGTKHHTACWGEHRGCSVFGCGSLEHAPAPAAVETVAASAVMAAVAEATPEMVVELPAPAPADPVG
jgi:hypothetical protein